VLQLPKLEFESALSWPPYPPSYTPSRAWPELSPRLTTSAWRFREWVIRVCVH